MQSAYTFLSSVDSKYLYMYYLHQDCGGTVTFVKVLKKDYTGALHTGTETGFTRFGSSIRIQSGLV